MDDQEALDLYFTTRDYMFSDIWHDWKKAKPIRKKENWKFPSSHLQQWKLIPAEPLKLEHIKHAQGREQDYDVILEIENQLMRNVIQLEINTIIFGHTPSDPYDVFEGLLSEDMTRNKFEKFFEDYEWWACNQHGSWAISDYGLDKLQRHLYDSMTADDPALKLTHINLALNVIHQRSDLSQYFVEGGSTTLAIIDQWTMETV